ncbi:hypothetical protein [Nonomuraea zeae]|uniref:hypothetical protein n=1 Tax=Nonomuraea zeae TaxID=1642303 RepID=UPI003609E5AD
MSVEMTQAKAREIAERVIESGFADVKGKVTDWLAARIVIDAEEGKTSFLSVETDPWMDTDYAGVGFTVVSLREAQKLV